MAVKVEKKQVTDDTEEYYKSTIKEWLTLDENKMYDNIISLGDPLKPIVENNKVTILDLAEDVNVPKAVIDKLKKGLKPSSLEKLKEDEQDIKSKELVGNAPGKKSLHVTKWIFSHNDSQGEVSLKSVEENPVHKAEDETTSDEVSPDEGTEPAKPDPQNKRPT